MRGTRVNLDIEFILAFAAPPPGQASELQFAC
jgi:hypothetical protein